LPLSAAVMRRGSVPRNVEYPLPFQYYYTMP
jgi:hypothetical protein